MIWVFIFISVFMLVWNVLQHLQINYALKKYNELGDRYLEEQITLATYRAITGNTLETEVQDLKATIREERKEEE